MNPLLAALPGNPFLWRVGAAVALALSCVLFGYVLGNKHGTAKLSSFILAQNAEATKVVARQEKAATKTEIQVREKVRIVKEKGDVIIKEVPVYVTKADDDKCVIPNGFVRLHTAAAENTAPGPASDSDRAPSGHSLSQVEEVDVNNFKALSECRAKLAGWIGFYSEIKKLRR